MDKYSTPAMVLIVVVWAGSVRAAESQPAQNPSAGEEPVVANRDAPQHDSADRDKKSADGQVSFVREVAPILINNCQACHGVKLAESSYRVDTYNQLMTAGDYETDPIHAGMPEESQLFQLITSDDPDQRMPLEGEPLSAEEITTIRRWIEQGARFDGADPKAALRSLVPRSKYPNAPPAYPAALPVTALIWSADGQKLVVGGYHELTVWSSQTGELLQRIGDVPERTYALNLAGDFLAVAGGSPGVSGEALLVDPQAGRRVASLRQTSAVMLDLALHPDGRQLAMASADRSVGVVDIESGDLLHEIENHADWVSAVSYSPRGDKLATASRDKSAKLFDADSGELLASYTGHGEPVLDVAFAPDGKAMYSSGADKEIHVWNPADGKKSAEINGLGGAVYRLLATSDHIWSAGVGKTVRQHTLDKRKEVRALSAHTDWVYALALHEKSGRLATGCHDGSVRVWNLANGELVCSFTAAPGLAGADRESPSQ